MALATQCPHCYTSFRVANDQLKLHAGMVRCGACKQTFNGIEHLLEPGEPPRTPPAADTETAPAVSEPTTDTLSVESAIANDKSTSANLETKEIGPDASPSETLEFEEIPEPKEELESYRATWTEESPSNSSDVSEAAEVATTSDDVLETADALNEPPPSQQELDDIALFQAKLASFAPQLDMPNPAPEVDARDEDHLITEHASAQLELIQADNQEELQAPNEDQTPATSAADEEQATDHPTRRQASLTASLDFELSDEERSWTDSAQVSQLEVKTQAAIIDGDDSKYSKHEPVFSDDTVLEDELEQDLHQLLAEVKTPEYVPPVSAPRKVAPSIPTEPVESTKDAEPEPTNDIDEDQPDFMLQAEKARRYSKLQYASLWFGVFLLFVTASAQGIYFFRSGIAAHFPQSKPLLVQMCQKLSCQLKLPTQIDAIVFDSTELLTLNQDPHILSLSLQLQNKSNMTQAWPMLELTLKDSRGKTVLQRVFTPEEYLESKALVSKGFNANSDSNIKVHFELSTMKAANYAVGVFYP